jgi:hypothetical protein
VLACWLPNDRSLKDVSWRIQVLLQRMLAVVHSKKEVSLPQAKYCLKLVPMEDIYPLFPSDFTLAPSISQPATLTAKVLQASKEAVSNPLSQYHLGAGYALN